MDYVVAFLGASPALLLLVVSLHHRWRVWSVGQSCWKGGGFAMFSDTLEHVPVTELWVVAGDGRKLRLPIDEGALPQHIWAAVIPTRYHMTKLGRAAAEGSWQQCGSGAHRSLPACGEPLRVARVVVRHRTVDFDATTGIHRAEERTTYEVGQSVARGE
jgi:hypothetical protein